MKKFLAFVLALAIVASTVSCKVVTEESKAESQASEVESTIEYNCKTMGHACATADPDDYVSYFVCDYCGTSYRRDSERIYDEDFVFTLTDERIAQTESIYNTLKDAIAAADRYDASKHTFVKDSDQYKKNKDFEHTYYDPFYDEVEYAMEQYQIANVQHSIKNLFEEYKNNFDKASDFYNDIVEMYYTLFRPIYETEYRDYFFSEEDGWDEESIQMALTSSDTYADGKVAALNKEIDAIQSDYKSLDDPGSSNLVAGYYAQIVPLFQQLAAIYGYDNYMDYAYENVYGRTYSREDTHKMRNFVKTYLGGSTLYDTYKASQNTSTYSYLIGSNATTSVFTSEKALKWVVDYFKTMTTDQSAETLNFYEALNELFKNGNYFTGTDDAAYTYYFPTKKMSFLYFGPKTYASAGTFVHEFGHYMNSVYNGGIDLSMDQDETQSQGNEFMFLAYLKECLSANGQVKRYKPLYASQLFDALSTILLATAIDEFEEVVYTGYYDGDDAYILKILSDGVVSEKEYADLFKLISEPYGINELYQPIYWKYVVVENPCYYISYSMAQIPSLSLYALYDKSGYEVAKDAYLKLFYFTDNEEFCHLDQQGNKICDVEYSDLLKYIGLGDAFTEQTFIDISAMYQSIK